MPQQPDNRTTSVLFIDSHTFHHIYWANQLRRCTYGYEIVAASDMQSGLDLYRSQRRIDCVVLELALPNHEGFKTLVELVPHPSKPQVAVVVLTMLEERSVWELAKEHGAYTCLAKQHTTGYDLDRAIQRAIKFVDQMPK